MTLQDLRLQANMTQEEVGRRLNVHQAAVSRWECGRFGISRKYIAPLAGLYGCSVDELKSAIEETKERVLGNGR